MPVTNTQMLEKVALAMPNMTTESAKQTAKDWAKNPGQMFQDNNNTNFLNTLATFTLDMIRVQDFYNPLEAADVINRKALPYGNVQRLYAPEIPSIDADFQKPMVNGTSSDMFKKRVVKPTQKFAYSNISYNNRITIPGAMFYTSTFNDGGGLVDWEAALTQSLLTTYSKWRFALFMDIIGRQTQSAHLQDTQTLGVTFADIDNPTIAEVAKFCQYVENVFSYARISGKKFNEDKFSYAVNTDNIRILVRIGFKNACRYALAQGSAEGFSINPEAINRVLDRCIEMPYLGVPKYYTDNTKANPLYPVYNAEGTITGLNTQEDGSGTQVALDAAYVEDDKSVVALMMDRNRINYITAMTAEGQPTEMQMGYTIYNYEGDYRNLYLRVLGNPSEGAGARLFGDSSYLFVQFVNTANA